MILINLSSSAARKTLFVLSYFVCLDASAQNQNIFVAGSLEKTLQMSSALPDNGSSSIFHNPSKLGLDLDQKQVDSEIGYALAFYKYNRPGFDPIRVKLRSPTIGLGFLSSKFKNPVRLGIFFLPERNSTTHIPGLPNKSSGEVGVFNIKLTETAFSLATGASFQINEIHRLGISSIFSYASRHLDVSFANQDELIYRSRSHYQTLTPLLGYYGRYSKTFELGLSYMFDTTRQSFGTFRDEVKSETKEPPQIIYAPASLRLAASFGSTDHEKITLSFNRILAAKGRGIFKDGIQSLNNDADLHDVNEYGALLQTTCSSSQTKLLLGLSHKQSPWGDGVASDSTGDHPKTLGVEFGLIDGIPRSGGGVLLRNALNWRDKTGHYDLGFSYLKGRKSVSSEGSGHGDYDFSFFTFNIAAALAL